MLSTQCICFCCFRVIPTINAAFFPTKGDQPVGLYYWYGVYFLRGTNWTVRIVQMKCTLHNLAGVVYECCLIHLNVLTTRKTSATVLLYPVLPASGRTLFCLKVPWLPPLVPSDNIWWWRWAWNVEQWRLTGETRSAVRETNLYHIYYMESSRFEPTTLRWEASHQPP